MVFKLLWPVLIVIGIVSIFTHGDGSGFEDPGFLLVPIGVIGGLTIISRKPRTRKSPMPPLVSLWVLAFLCAAKIYFAESSVMLGDIPWVLAMFGLTIAGWTLLVFHLFRKEQ